jgi:hypothetical protein
LIPLQSSLENTEKKYVEFRTAVEPIGYTLGGNWDYEHGCFDKALDSANKVWLRLPFEVAAGNFDGDQQDSDCVIKLGEPFILKHLYQEGLDEEANIHTYGSFIDQFQDPIESDAPVDPEWIDKAERALREAEDAVFTPINA